ncbi:MAG TPA: fibronectin type III domain-containing protein [Mycobacterium sp.]|nr:fibronectin type III domain-containing protein [Mycobacterium sp.]
MAMYRIPVRRIVGGLAGAVGMLSLVLSSGGVAAADEEFPPPENVLNTSLKPRCMNITWQHAPEDVVKYTVERAQPFPDFAEIDPAQQSHHSCGIEPDSDFHVEVCAFSVEERACTEADFHTPPLQPEQQQGPKPTPRITQSNSGVDWIDFRWEAGFDYNHYWFWYIPRGGQMQGRLHDDDGTWGYDKVTGLQPNTTYDVIVQGCTTSDIPFVEDTCWGKSAPHAITTGLPYGPDTCASGFVWRDAVPGDHICVTPERRQKVADDFRTAGSRSPLKTFPVPAGTRCNPLLKKVGDPPPPGCSPGGTEICNDGFVPRDVPGENVIVCVTPDEAALIAQENANPKANRVRP